MNDVMSETSLKKKKNYTYKWQNKTATIHSQETYCTLSTCNSQAICISGYLNHTVKNIIFKNGALASAVC